MVAAGRSVTETLVALNDKLADELASREFVALALARYVPSTGHLELVNAGLPDPYVLRRDKVVEVLTAPQPRLPLGIFPHVDYQRIATQLAPGDRCLLLTDGLPEALTDAGEPLGYEALATMIGTLPKQPPSIWLDALLGAVATATSEVPEDDWTSIVIERVG